jgi:hypothetical protein
MIEKGIWFFYGTLLGVGLGIYSTYADLELAKEYNLASDRAIVDASQMYFEALEHYNESMEVADEAIDVCLGRLGL